MSEEYRNALPVGTVIDVYQIERVLGVGGFGITYLVSDLNLGKYYAIKELLPDGIAMRQMGDTTFVEAKSRSSEEDFAATRKYFIAEAQVLAGMDHPAVVKVHRLMEANGTCYMVMDYIEGETLSDYLKKRGGTLRSGDEFQQVFLPVMSGLEDLHNLGFIHRDIKPGNIMIRPDGTPVLLDFGAATQTQSQTMTITQMLSAGYSPFEQYTSRAKQGPYTDIYALGATMHKCITGKKPDDASDRVYEDTYRSLLWNEAYVAVYGRSILAAVDAALKMEPKERPQNMVQWRALMSGAGEASTWEEEPEMRLVEREAQPLSTASSQVAEGWHAQPPVWASGLDAKMTNLLSQKWVGAVLVALVLAFGLLTWSPWNRDTQTNEDTSEAQAMPEVWDYEEIGDALSGDAGTLEPDASVEDTPDSLTDDFIVQINSLGKAMMSVKDKASAEAAVGKLTAIATEIEKIATRLDKLGTPTGEEKSRIEEKTKSASMAMLVNIEGPMQALSSNEAVMGIIDPAVEGFLRRVDAVKPVFDRFGTLVMRVEARGEAERSSDPDSRMAALHIARGLYVKGEGFPRDFFDRVDKGALKSLAEEGNAEAQFLWGRAHHSSLGLLSNDHEAVQWYRKAAERENAHAQYELALMYVHGKGVAKNGREALKWGQRAAQQGHAWAQYYLGRCYLLGNLVSQDKDTAKMWLTKAYKNNDAKAKKAAADLWAEEVMARRHNDLYIIKATYGAENTHRDVTAIVRNKINNGRLDFRAHSGELGGDPIFGKVKEFKIRYQQGGQVYTKSYREGSQVNLP